MSCLWNWRFLDVQCLSWPNTLRFMWKGYCSLLSQKHWRNEDNYIMSCLQNWLFWVYYARVVQILSVSCEQIKHCTLLLQNTLKEYNCIMSCLWNWRFLEVQCLSWPNTLSFMWTDSTLYISFTECTDILMNTGIQLNPNQCKPLFKLN